MDGFDYTRYEQLYNLNRQLFYELQQIKMSICQFQNMIHMLYGQVYGLSMQNSMLQWTIAWMRPPVYIENFNFSHDVNLDELKVNSIQSGAALNIGEWICSRTNSDMDMKMGSNSHNSGDCNEMRCCDDTIVRDGDKENREKP